MAARLAPHSPGEFLLDRCGDPARKALEAIAIAEHQVSPRWNFGRMPAGYRMSSGNNPRLVAADKRKRGGPVVDSLPAHLPGIAPKGLLDCNAQADRWCGHQWSDWRPLTPAHVAELSRDSGLYRIRGLGGSLVYVGEGSVRARLRAHAAKLGRDSAQGAVLGAAAPLGYSFVLDEHCLQHQRLELETDLIAAHTLAFAAPPAAQFIG